MRSHSNELCERKSRSPVATAVAAAVSFALYQAAQAQNAQPQQDVPQQQSAAEQQADSVSSMNEVVVTATRRAESIQKVPLNISAIDGSQIAEKGLKGLNDLLRETPGIFSQSRGRADASEIVARGLSVGGTPEPGYANNDTGGVVSTYVGDIPVFVDLRLTDLERVEVLLGPQGTLYGAGTLGGAVRYIPRKPRFDATELSVRGSTFGVSESDGIGGDGGVTVNIPISDTLAFRGNVDYLYSPGFIDDNFILRNPGVSDPQPNTPADVATNLRRVKDANREHTLSAHGALRFKPIDAVDATLNFYFQRQDIAAGEGNSVASMGTGKYESAERFLQAQRRRNQIGSLEVTTDLGFADLTSATGYTKYHGHTLVDQNDLLMTISLSYAAFPDFADYSPYHTDQDRFSQELRLVSKLDGPVNFIAGGFFDRKRTFTTTPEYAPNFSAFALANLGWGGELRTDDLEYVDISKIHQKEKAAFGEVTFKATDAWKIIAGARWYDYDQSYAHAVDTPLYYTSYVPIGDPLHQGPTEVVAPFNIASAHDSGYLTKFSTSYEFTNDLMAYFTRSEGYRIGSTNSFPLCDPDGDGVSNFNNNIGCATPSEYSYRPDQTTNYELGVRSQWLEHRLTVNSSLFYVLWHDPQLGGSTAQGAGNITTNGKGARSQGVDLSVNAAVTNRLKVSASYTFTDAILTEDAPNLLRNIYLPGEPMVPNADPAVCTPNPDGTGLNPGNPFDSKCYPVDGKAGDRLPHSPRHQGNFYMSYTKPLGQQNLIFHYGISAISNILTTVGARADGEVFGGYALNNTSVDWESNKWTLSLYCDNLFNKFAKTDVRRNRRYLQTLQDINGDPVNLRTYTTFFINPRQYGLRFSYNFDM